MNGPVKASKRLVSPAHRKRPEMHTGAAKGADPTEVNPSPRHPRGANRAADADSSPLGPVRPLPSDLRFWGQAR